jgi:anti-anti-sigma factor
VTDADPAGAGLLYDAGRGVYYARPVLRGWLHLLCFWVSLAGGVLLLARAHGAVQVTAAAVYSASLSALLGTSALYRRRTWTAAWRVRLRHLDCTPLPVPRAAAVSPVAQTGGREGVIPAEPARDRVPGVVCQEEASRLAAGSGPRLAAVQEGTPMFSMSVGSGEPGGGYVVVVLRGELDCANSARVAALLESVAAREPRIVVDLSGLEFIDVSGARALSRGREDARSAGGDLVVAAPQRRVQRILACLWKTAGPGIYPSAAAAAVSARASLRGVTPARWPPARMRYQRIVMNALAPQRRAGNGGSLEPGCQPPQAGGISAGQPPGAD